MCGVCVQSRSDLFPLTTELPPWFSVQEQEKWGTQIHANTDTHTYTHAHTHTHRLADPHTNTHMHTRTHTDMQTHTNT